MKTISVSNACHCGRTVLFLTTVTAVSIARHDAIAAATPSQTATAFELRRWCRKYPVRITSVGGSSIGVGPRFSGSPGGAPVRLYFYAEEEEVARVATPFIERAYASLSDWFRYVPSHTVPLHLYNSHFEFESMRELFVSETVLGVTSPKDLTMALPYWGEAARFEHVLRHELVHQFTIQYLADLGQPTKCNPLDLLPLWFIEGLAEFVALEGLTPEVRAALADGFVDRDGIREEPAISEFFAPGPATFERVYLIGHAQLRFLEEHKGEGTVRRLLQASASMCEDRGRLFGPSATPFISLVQRELGLNQEEIDQGWRAWATAQVAPSLQAKNPLSSLLIVDDLGRGQIDSYSLSPDGSFVFCRLVDTATGISRLVLHHLPSKRTKKIVEDRAFSLVTLHPFDRRVIAIGETYLAYVGRVGATDRLRVQTYKFDGDDFEIGPEIEHRLDDFGALIEAGYPAIDDRTDSLLFSGLSRSTGALNIYRMAAPLNPYASITQVTSDAYAEIELSVSGDKVWLASGATPDGRPEIAWLGDDGYHYITNFPGATEVAAPAPDGRGGIVFQAGTTGLMQAYHYSGSGSTLTRISDVPTGLTSPSMDSSGALLGIVSMDEKRHLVRIPPGELVAEQEKSTIAESMTPWPVVKSELLSVREYSAASLKSWRLDSLLGAATTGPLIFAFASFSDQFRERVAQLSVQVLEDLDRTNASAIYLNQSGRLSTGVTLFFDSSDQLDARSSAWRQTLFLRQRFGGSVIAAYPFNQFLRLDASAGIIGLRGLQFEEPDGELADQFSGTHPAAELGVGIVLDTLRVAPVGAIQGTTASLSLEGTLPVDDIETFTTIEANLEHYLPLISGYRRLFAHGRLAGGMVLGGQEFAEQFYLPAAFNLHALHDGSLSSVGTDFGLAQLSVSFPLAPPLGEYVFLQGLIGADIGAVTFGFDNFRHDLTAAAVGGVDLVFTPLILRLQLARAFDVGGRIPTDDWVGHLALVSPFAGLF